MKDRILKTCKENAFLIFLFICVCIVAISTISIVMREMDKDRGKDDLVILDNPGETDSNPANQDIGNASLDAKTGEITLNYANGIDDSNQETGEEDVQDNGMSEEVFYEGEDELEDDEIEFIDNYQEEQAEPSSEMIYPVQGEVITAFAQDTLIYSETLEEWRGHSGIDIRVPQGTTVIAPMDGKIKEANEDELWGKTIVIDHGNGLETKFCNLGTLEMVKVGIDVKQGDHIATVGKTAQIELLMDDHLHFEVIKNQKTVDPRSILK